MLVFLRVAGISCKGGLNKNVWIFFLLEEMFLELDYYSCNYIRIKFDNLLDGWIS
jgi:hypothetical protein